MQERFEDTKVVVRNCKSKVRQYNSERKKNKQDLQNTSLYRKLKNKQDLQNTSLYRKLKNKQDLQNTSLYRKLKNEQHESY